MMHKNLYTAKHVAAGNVKTAIATKSILVNTVAFSVEICSEIVTRKLSPRVAFEFKGCESEFKFKSESEEDRFLVGLKSLTVIVYYITRQT